MDHSSQLSAEAVEYLWDCFGCTPEHVLAESRQAEQGGTVYRCLVENEADVGLLPNENRLDREVLEWVRFSKATP